MAAREITLKLYIEHFMLEKINYWEKCFCFLVSFWKTQKSLRDSVEGLQITRFVPSFFNILLLLCICRFYGFLTICDRKRLQNQSNCPTKAAFNVVQKLLRFYSKKQKNWNLVDIFIDSKNTEIFLHHFCLPTTFCWNNGF